MSDEQARALLAEATRLRDMARNRETSWDAVRDPLIGAVSRAETMTSDPDLLVIGANLVQQYAGVDGEARELMNRCRRRADSAGGARDPSVRNADERNRKVAPSGGCLVAITLAVLAATAVAVRQ